MSLGLGTSSRKRSSEFKWLPVLLLDLSLALFFHLAWSCSLCWDKFMLVSHLICIFCSAPDFGLTTFFFLIFYLLCKTLRKIQDGNKELNVSICDGFTQYIFLRTYYVPDTIGHVIVYKNIYCFSHFCVCVCVCAKIWIEQNLLF